ncbi:MAG: dTMP kinase [Patescibacteria group bacterium]|jgi:thymidylate kinase|nr:dTMP kinase [Patescibacteria group bacterium]
MSGKLIALYGINNLGKSTQAKRLVERLIKEGKEAYYLKYPLYNLAPSGQMINGYLRNGNPYELSPREYQIVHVVNRTQYDAALRARLMSGEWIVVEDYVGTGMAWGVGAGVDEAFLQELNSHLLREDLPIFMDGERFMEAKEEGHKHETDDVLMAKVKEMHHTLAKKNGWFMVNANQTRDEVHEDIWKHVKRLTD